MVLPVTLFNQVIRVVVRGMIAARAIVELLEVESLWPDAEAADDAADPAPAESTAMVLRDSRTGIAVRDGELLAVVALDPQEARVLVDRLARLSADGEADPVLLHGRPLSELPVSEVRRRIAVSDPVPILFSGTLRELLDPWGRHDDRAILRAVSAVDADDLLAPLEEGLDAQVGERGIEFSGGQRQRLGAARALLAEAPILVLHDPTSAVDAATEERMARGIRAHRAGATTIVLTTSPLVLGNADRVVVVDGSAIRAEGTQRGAHPPRSGVSQRRAQGGGRRMTEPAETTRTALPRASGARVRRELRGIWSRDRGRFLLVVLLNGAAAASSLIPPRLIGLLIDRLRAGADVAEVAVYGGVMLAGVLAQSLFVLAAARSAWRLGEDVFARLRLAFLSDAVAVPMGVIETAGTGELVTRTTQDINAVGETVRWALPGCLVSALTVVMTLVAAVVASPLIAPVYLIALPALIVLMRWYTRRAPDVYRRLGDSYGPTYASLDETANGARAIEALSLQQARQRSMVAALVLHWTAAVERIRLRQIMLPWANLAFAIPVFSSLAWGGWLAVHGQVSVGTVVTVTLYAAALVAPLESLIDWTDELQRSYVSFARILGVGEAVGHRSAAAAEPASTHVELQGVSFAYRAGREVLHDVSLRIVPGERLAIVGPSGAGNRRWRGCWREWTTRPPVASRWAGWTRPRSRSRTAAATSSWSHRRATCSRRPCGRTCCSAVSTRRIRMSRTRWPGSARPIGSTPSTTAGTPRSAQAGGRSPAPRSSSWRSPVYCSPTRTRSSSTRRPARWIRPPPVTWRPRSPRPCRAAP